MNKIEEFEQHLKMAYLNYENNDLEETLKYLDRILNLILKDDKSLENDPFWKTLTCDVFKAVILNKFYNKVELTGNDLDSLLENEEEMKKNIKEFCDNFRNNEFINFISHIENITDNPLKSVIEILMTDIGKMNIANVKVETSNNNQIEENKIQKIECFCGNLFDFDWSKIPNTEKTTYMKCPNCDSELKRGNPYYHDYHQTLSNEQLSALKSNVNITNSYSNSEVFDLGVENVFGIWNTLKNKNPQLKGFCEETEKYAISELIEAKDKVRIKDKLLAEYLNGENLSCDNLKLQHIISWLGFQSIVEKNYMEDNINPYVELKIHNVGLFRAVLAIYIVYVIYCNFETISMLNSFIKVESFLNIKCIYENKISAEALSPVLTSSLPKMFNIKKIDVLYVE